MTTRAPFWLGVITDHLFEDCRARRRTRVELEWAGSWRQGLGTVDPWDEAVARDLCGWCVRVWRAHNPKEAANEAA